MIPPTASIYTNQAYVANYANTASFANNSATASYFFISGSLTCNSINIVGGGVAGSIGTGQVTCVSSSQVIDIIPLNRGNSVKWFVFSENQSNSKVNKIVASWNNITSSFYTTEVRATGYVPVELSIKHSSSGISLFCNPETGSWSVKFIRILI